MNWPDAKATLKTWSLWVHYVIYFGAGCAITSLSLFAPTIVAGLGYKDLHAQLFTIPPFAIAYIFTIGTAFLSDHYHSRGIIGGCGTIVGSLGFAISGTIQSSHRRVPSMAMKLTLPSCSAEPILHCSICGAHHCDIGSILSFASACCLGWR